MHNYSIEDVDYFKNRVKELELQLNNARAQLQLANSSLQKYELEKKISYQQNQDYLPPYEEHEHGYTYE